MDRRWRGGPTDHDAPDGDVDRGAWPGKRPLVGADSAGSASPWPGKRSRTSAMRKNQATTLSGKPLRTMGDIAQETIDRKGGGQPVDQSVRAKVEPRLGIGLGDVRVHTDDHSAAGAAGIQARAFTYGKDVFLGHGEQPTDLALMAHELTHVAQQSDEPRRQVAVGAQDHPAEREADAVAASVTGDHSSGQPSSSARVVDDGTAPAAGQMTRGQLMTKLREVAVQTASSSIGPLWREEQCAYIDDWFARHASTPAAQLEALLQRFTNVRSPASADEYLAPVGTHLADSIARWRGGGDITSDLAAAGVTSDVPTAAAGAGAPTGTAQAKHADGAFEAGSPAAIASELGDGQPLDAGVASKVGDAYGASFSGVRVHTDGVAARMASDQGATAFAVGEHVAFSSGAYQPNTPHGDALIAHELAHVVQQQQLGPAAIQKKKIDEDSHEATEVEADQAATGFMARAWGGAKTAVKKITEVATKSQMARCASGGGVAIPKDPFVARLHAKLYSTPPDYANFFADIAGLNRARAGDAVLRGGLQTFVTNSKLTNAQAWRAVAYEEYGADAGWPLPVKNFAEGVDAGKMSSTFPPGGGDALRQYCVVTAGTTADGSATVTQTYRNQFNAKFDDPALSAISADFDPALNSKGPRTPRARKIFEDMYAFDPAIKNAYDHDAPPGFRNTADTLVGPDGSNLTGSMRLQDLRAQLNGAPVVAPNTTAPAYTAFIGTVTPLAQALDARDRQEIQRSHTWRLASDAKVNGPLEVKDDLWSVVTTSRAAAPVGPAPVAPVIAPPVPPVPNAAQDAFLKSIHITAPASPSNATKAEHPLAFQIRGAANPGLAVNRKIVVEPAAQVLDGAPDESPWANGAVAADATVNVDPQPTGGAPSTVFTAKLTMPPLAAATFAEKQVNVTVVDKRLDWVRTNASAGLLYVDDNQPTWVNANDTIHYTGKQCPITISPTFPAANPGLDLQMDGELKKAGVVVQAMPRIPFGAHSTQATLLNTILQEPAPPPAVPEHWELSVRFYLGAAAAVVHPMVVPFKIAKSKASNLGADTATMNADNAWLNQPIATAGTLLNTMRAAGGHTAAVANAVATGALKVKGCFVRSDSKDAVNALHGDPNTQVAYAMGVVDPLGVAANTLVAQPGATGWRWGVHADTVFLNRTITHGGAHRATAELSDFLAHEGTHAADRDGGAPGDWDSYVTEFRAYWIEGTGAGKPTTFDPSMTGLGPKAPRAREIFEFLYGSATYPFVKPAYDGNVAGFRERADNYLFPDGINLTLSGTLSALRTEIETGTPVAPAGFAAKKAAVLAKLALCTPSDRTEIRTNREWRDLVEVQFTGNTAAVPPTPQKDDIKIALGIPT